MPTVTFRGSRAELRELIRSIPAILSGRAPDPAGVARGFQLRLSMSLLSQCQADFLTKSRGGCGQDGITWAPLKGSTIARRAGKERKALKGGRGSPAFAGNRDILRDTGRLFRSLSAGVEETPAGNPDQVLRLGRGEVIVGTNVPYAAYHQYGTARMPARPFLPVDGIPAAYQPALFAAAGRGLIRVLQLLIDQRAR